MPYLFQDLHLETSPDISFRKQRFPCSIQPHTKTVKCGRYPGYFLTVNKHSNIYKRHDITRYTASFSVYFYYATIIMYCQKTHQSGPLNPVTQYFILVFSSFRTGQSSSNDSAIFVIDPGINNRVACVETPVLFPTRQLCSTR